MSTHSNYNKLLEQAREAGTILARTWIPRLCQALKRENPEMPSEDVKETVTKDCADIWSRATIRNNMPGEFKDPQKQEAGKKGREKQLEQLIPAGGAHTTGAEDSSVSETEQGSVDFDSI